MTPAPPPTDTAPLGGWNAALRFLLELAALAGWAGLGATVASGAWRIPAAILVAGSVAAAWGTFRVPGDPGPAPVTTPGVVRLCLEAIVFVGGAIGLSVAFGPVVGAVDAAALLLHHVAALPRLRWILAH